MPANIVFVRPTRSYIFQCVFLVYPLLSGAESLLDPCLVGLKLAATLIDSLNQPRSEWSSLVRLT